MVGTAGGEVSGVTWDGPAFDAGMTVSDVLVAVNGEAFTPDRLKAAIAAAKGTKTPVQLTVKEGERYRTVALDYHGGLRYPRLEKVGTGEGGLDRLLAPR